MSAVNLKRLLVTDSVISALASAPAPGVDVSFTKKLEIRNSVFKEVYPR